MQLHKIIKLLFLLLSALALSYASAEEVLLPEEEDSPVLYSGSLGDADVDLFITGSWQLDASYGTSLPLPGSLPVSHPDIFQSLYFRQIPDLTISLWLLNRYFIETTFYPGLEDNTYVMGYRGEEEEFIKSVRIGNSGLGIPSKQLLSIPEGSSRGFGGYIRFGTDEWDNQMLLRYDSYARETVEYRGTSEVFNVSIPLEHYIRGSGFLLPDTRISEVTVFTQSYSGLYTGDDGQSYEVVDPDNYILYKETGYIHFHEPLTRKTLVFYRTASGDVGSPGGGTGGLTGTSGGGLDAYADPEDFSWTGSYLGALLSQYRVNVSGPSSYAALAIWDGGSFSPFESTANYSLPGVMEGSSISGYITSPDSESKDMQITLKTGDGIVHIVAPETMPDAGSRFPFTEFIAKYYQGLSGSLSGYMLNVEQLLQMKSIPIPGNAIPGSVSVFVNGIKSQNYQVRNGNIEFPFPIRDTDRIKVIYSREGGETNTLLQTSLHSYRVSDHLTVTGSSAFMWALPRSSASDYYGQYPGLVAGNIGFDYAKDNLEVSLNYSASLGTEDSAGKLLLSNLLDNAAAVNPAGNLLPPAPSTAFPVNLRVLPVYRDYRLITQGGLTFLQDINAPEGQENVSSSEPGSQIGPYPAKADSLGISGVTAVAEAVLPSGSWTGVTINLDDSFSVPDSISFDAAYRGTGEIDLYIRLGAIDEDIDGDGILDEETTPESRGFIFNDGGNMYRFGGGIVYPGNGYRETEDLNGDSILTPEVGGLVYESPMLGALSEASGVQRFSIEFTNSQKALLKDLRALQIIAQNTDTAAASGRLIAGEILIESQGVRVGGDSGRTAYDADREQLTYSWNSGTDPNRLTLPLSSFPLRGYQSLEFSWSLPQSSQIPADAVFRIHTGPASGYEASVQLQEDTLWHEARFDLKEASVNIDGTEYPLTRTGTPVSPERAKVQALSIEFPASSSGVLKLTKPYAVSPDNTVDHGLQTRVSLNMPNLLSWLGVRIDSDITAASGNVANTLIPELSSKHLRVLEEQTFTLPFGQLILEEDIFMEETQTTHAWGHNLRLTPLRGVTVTDTFRISGLEEDLPLTAGNTLKAGGRFASIESHTALTAAPEEMSHSMGGTITIPVLKNGSLSISEDLDYSLREDIGNPDYWTGYTDAKSRLFLPRSSEAFLRKTETAADMSYTRGTESRLLAGVSAQSTSTFTPSPSSDWQYTWDLRYTFPLNSGSVTLRGEQKSTVIEGWDREGDFMSDKERLFSILGNHYSTLLAIPGYHMYPKLYNSAKPLQNSYLEIESKAGAGLGRRPGSSLVHLVVPVRIEYDVLRNVILHETSLEDTYIHTAAVKWEGRNLFGAYGRYRLFSLYESEDIYTYARTTYNSEEAIWSVDISSRFTFYNNGAETVDILHEFIYSDAEYTDLVNVKHYWNTEIRERRFFHDSLVTDEILHTEEVSGEFGWNQDMSSQSILLKHSSDLVFEEFGTAGAYLKAGIIRRDLDGGSRAGLGLEFGIRGKLVF